MKKSLLFSGCLMLSGCGGPEAVWVHDNKGKEGFLSDRELCNRRIDPGQAGYGDRFAECMTLFGWRLENH